MESRFTYSKDGFEGLTVGRDFVQNKALTLVGIKTPDHTTLRLVTALFMAIWLLSKVMLC